MNQYDEMARKIIEEVLLMEADEDRMDRLRTFLAAEFAQRDRLIETQAHELKALRQWKKAWMPVVVDWSEHH